METLRLIFSGSSTVLSLASLLLAAIAYQSSQRTYHAGRRQHLTQLRIEVLKTYATAAGRMQEIVRATSLALAEDIELSTLSPTDPPHSLLFFLRNQLKKQDADARNILSTIEESLRGIEATWHGTSEKRVEEHTEMFLEALAGAHRVAAIAQEKSWDRLIDSFRNQLALRKAPPANDT